MRPLLSMLACARRKVPRFPVPCQGRLDPYCHPLREPVLQDGCSGKEAPPYYRVVVQVARGLFDGGFPGSGVVYCGTCAGLEDRVEVVSMGRICLFSM